MAKPSKYARAQRRLRALGWLVVALAVIHAGQGTTAPGGAKLGLILAGALAWQLHRTRNTHRKTRRG